MVKNAWICTSTIPLSSRSGAEFIVGMENFTVINFEVFVAVIVESVVFWVVTTCSFVGAFLHIGAYRVRAFAPQLASHDRLPWNVIISIFLCNIKRVSLDL
jgi:hypothetical protein